jgi:hypothetical protein
MGGMLSGLFSTTCQLIFTLSLSPCLLLLLSSSLELVNNPFDVVKTRMQGSRASMYKNTMDCFVQMYKVEGPMVFYSGLVPRLGRVLPGQGIIFMSFETIQGWVDTFFDK